VFQTLKFFAVESTSSGTVRRRQWQLFFF